jgi:hypothetical protein
LLLGAVKNGTQWIQLGDVAIFVNRQPGTAAKSLIKSSLLILLAPELMSCNSVINY